ncbi:carboxypeptidase-like regulatory domain-containing protein [Algoriphagus sp. AGSA1]|uniref:carboxypeptidase-like regulatory domain-containing protein n=1 Tax=Algoriphagus sp. AGSA1 TaxID=2907213 RepID=UPI001F1A75B8|nr:carboxypeptidase-like regulatory domain-containing protein [Algoriphagus sp. AGSA1]
MMLAKKIQFENSDELTLRQMLDTLSTTNNFYFSYESSLLKLDRPLINNHYSGSIGNLLVQELGNEYEFKELPGYIIIRYAPEKLDLDAEMETQFNRVTVKGYIKNTRTNEGVSQASIYDKNSLVSTLTDENGFFKLKYKKNNASIWLTLSKENYRDTTFLLLPVVNIKAKKDSRTFRYIPGDGTTQEIEESFLGNLFIGFRQRLQGINVGSYFAESPVQMSLVPGVSSKGMFNSQTISNFSLNLIGGYTAGIEGLEVAGIFNINKRDVKSVQVAGIFNLVGGSSQGLQVGGIYNSVYKNVQGLQIGGIYNHVKGNVKGLQIGGIANRVDRVADVQIGGIVNHAQTSRNFQLAGIGNHASESAAFQLSGISNVVSDSVNNQFTSIINRAKVVNGFQFGLVNIAEENDYPIGFLNFIKNGEMNLAYHFDESGFSHLNFRSGGKKTYGILGIAYQHRDVDAPYAFEVGFGFHILTDHKFSLDSEFVALTASDFVSIYNNVQSFRLIAGVKMGNSLRIFAGPSLNFAFLDPGQTDFVGGWNIMEKTTIHGIYRSYGGVTAGLQLIL